MDFVQFCRAHGVMIDSVPPLGVWRRFPTDDHPHKKNGAVKYMGDHGFVQNHATQTQVSVWRTDKPVEIDHRRLAQAAKQAQAETEKRQEEAARKAQWIINQCTNGFHDYLKRKGFLEQAGYIWVTEGKQILVIPMRIDGKLVGCQMIDQEGGKKFLFGQKTAGAEFIFDNKGPHIYCEGYATALSLREVLRSLKKTYTLHVCFSAGNMKNIAAKYGSGVVVADNDESKTGEVAARAIGFPYFLPPTVGQDFNDFHREVGLLRASFALDKLLRARKVG